MRFTIPTLALFSALATAMPTTASEGDGRGAAIWSEQKYAGQSVAIPGNEYCADLGMIMPNLEGKGRSIMVEADYRCQFYTEWGCNREGPMLDFGRKGVRMVMAELGGYDRKVMSARCTRIR